MNKDLDQLNSLLSSSKLLYAIIALVAVGLLSSLFRSENKNTLVLFVAIFRILLNAIALSPMVILTHLICLKLGYSFTLSPLLHIALVIVSTTSDFIYSLYYMSSLLILIAAFGGVYAL